MYMFVYTHHDLNFQNIFRKNHAKNFITKFLNFYWKILPILDLNWSNLNSISHYLKNIKINNNKYV
jgi:hypothetical protein